MMTKLVRTIDHNAGGTKEMETIWLNILKYLIHPNGYFTEPVIVTNELLKTCFY